jgi:hypothetical protein
MIARAATAIGLALFARAAAAQGLAARVAAAPDGIVRFAFAARAGICGDGRDFITRDDCTDGHCARHRSMRNDADDDDWDWCCEQGPVRVALNVREGRVESVRTRVGGHPRTSAPAVAVTDFGTVATRDAADFLLALARRSGGRAGEEAILPATLADSVTVWPELLGLARDASVPGRTRRQAVFWLGWAAGEATRALTGLVEEAGVDREVKEAAVFALSQRPRAEGVPALIGIARTHPDPQVRRRALFWLGESNDPRALALFEELLTKP